MIHLFFLTLLGCAIAPETPVNTLSDADWSTVCEPYVNDSSPENCGLFELQAPSTLDTCVNEGLTVFGQCDFNLEQYQTCMDARQADACAALSSEACAPIAACIRDHA